MRNEGDFLFYEHYDEFHFIKMLTISSKVSIGDLQTLIENMK